MLPMRRVLVLLLLAVLAGCADAPVTPPPSPDASALPASSTFPAKASSNCQRAAVPKTATDSPTAAAEAVCSSINAAPERPCATRHNASQPRARRRGALPSGVALTASPKTLTAWSSRPSRRSISPTTRLASGSRAPRCRAC